MASIPLQTVTLHGHEVSYRKGGELVERLVLVCSGGLGREVSWMLRALTLPGAELVMPTLIVWGDQDPIIPLDHGRAAHEAIAGSRLEVLEGCGHFPHVEDPVRFVEVLEDFIATTEPARADPAGFRELLADHAGDGGLDRLTGLLSGEPG